MQLNNLEDDGLLIFPKNNFCVDLDFLVNEVGTIYNVHICNGLCHSEISKGYFMPVGFKKIK